MVCPKVLYTMSFTFDDMGIEYFITELGLKGLG